MDTSKRSGITQSSPLKIPYKSLTERRISSVFTSGLTEISKLDELGSDRNLSPIIDIVTKFLLSMFASCSSIQAKAGIKSFGTLGKIKDTQLRSKHDEVSVH